MQRLVRLTYSSLLTITFTACAASTPSTPATPTPPSTTPPAVPPPAAPAIHRLDAGGWPGSNTHMWGSRSYELRKVATGIEARVHDAIDFQGSGMQPEDMGPTRHGCTPWRPLPPAIAMPATNSCATEAATCEAIRVLFKGIERGGGSCD